MHLLIHHRLHYHLRLLLHGLLSLLLVMGVLMLALHLLLLNYLGVGHKLSPGMEPPLLTHHRMLTHPLLLWYKLRVEGNVLGDLTKGRKLK